MTRDSGIIEREMGNAPGYKQLKVYKEAHVLVLLIYKTTKQYPKDELFGLISQMRRCSVSVAANLIEGYGRNTKKEFRNFCYIARGSLTELEYYLDLSLDLKYISKEEYNTLSISRATVGKLLSGFIRSLA